MPRPEHVLELIRHHRASTRGDIPEIAGGPDATFGAIVDRARVMLARS